MISNESSMMSSYGESSKISFKESFKKPKTNNDFICEVCGDGDYEDDDLIVICSKCEMAFHTKCYGIVKVPKEEWYCTACENHKDAKNLKCALCPNKNGALKLTINITNVWERYPNYD